MITKKDIDKFIDKIPPAPKVLNDTISLLNEGELMQASNIAKTDLALSSYLKNLVNRPVYGFKHEVNDISQIFGILGLAGSQQAVYNYLLNILSPDKWTLFKLNANSFAELQAELSAKYNTILEYLKIVDKDIQSAVSLLPASIIVTEALFNDKIKDVEILREAKEIDYNTILKRLGGLDIFDLCERIAVRWEMPKKISCIIQASSGIKPSKDETINNIAKWTHLLFFYELSKPMFIEANLNDFIDFRVEFVEDIYDDFLIAMKVND
jgi:HD-like signal output (HDOD) protein